MGLKRGSLPGHSVQKENRAYVEVLNAMAEPRWSTSCRREPVEEGEPHVTQQRLFWQDSHWSFWGHQAFCL